MWKRINTSERFWLSETDECYYKRDRTARGGYSASEGNQLISNLKKHPSKKGTYEWKHKQRAVEQFAKELLELVEVEDTIVFIPSSKTNDDDEFDPRMEMLAKELHRLEPDLRIEAPIVRVESMQSAHLGGKRKPTDIENGLKWVGLQELPDPPVVWLVDDVLTTGSHFKVCKRLLLDEHDGLTVKGAFWVRTVWPDENDEDDEDE